MCATDPSLLPEPGSQLEKFWSEKVSELVKVEVDIRPEQQERHRIYLLMLMALVADYWNPFKQGRKGMYPRQVANAEHWAWATQWEYKGHNIAALAVDKNGRVLDFNFNHNKLFNSSAEHAEARLVRRIFALAHIQDTYGEIETETPERKDEYDTLNEVTIYTSLESCAQCAGMMALGNVKEVVYLQTDPGMYMIGNILHNLSGSKPKAPLPIRASQVGLEEYQSRLEGAYEAFKRDVKDPDKPFWVPPTDDPEYEGVGPDHSSSISSFLATPEAADIFKSGGDRFEAMTPAALRYGTAKGCARDGQEVGKTNAQVLEHAKEFLAYAKTNGRRGTPHRV